MFRHRYYLLVLLLFICACSNNYYYIKGLKHAEYPKPEDVYDNLTRISPDNEDLVRDTIDGVPYVLAVTWKDDTSFYTNKNSFDADKRLYRYNTRSRRIFVTIVPYLKRKQFGHLNDHKLNMRLNQLLGLPPVSKYSYFIELWVRPEDLFRPCFDNATNTNVCKFEPTRIDSTNASYLSWLYQYIDGSYKDTDMMKRFPFTHLGYTYDWSPKNKSHEGLSEFIIDTGKNVYIKKIYTTRGYFE